MHVSNKLWYGKQVRRVFAVSLNSSRGSTSSRLEENPAVGTSVIRTSVVSVDFYIPCQQTIKPVSRSEGSRHFVVPEIVSEGATWMSRVDISCLYLLPQTLGDLSFGRDKRRQISEKPPAGWQDHRPAGYRFLPTSTRELFCLQHRLRYLFLSEILSSPSKHFYCIYIFTWNNVLHTMLSYVGLTNYTI